jgi:hypothetical protein
MGSGRHRTETGSLIDVKGMNGDVGLVAGTETSAGSFTADIFPEYGDGTFDSYSDFGEIADFHGEGDVSNIGGGVFAGSDVGQADSGRSCFEVSVRFGRSDAEFRTRDFDFDLANGHEFRYDIESRYRGFHAGGGCIMGFSGFDGTPDLSVMCFRTRRAGADFYFDGDRVSRSSVPSSLVVAGRRLTAGIAPSVKTYFGLHCGHEFDCDSTVKHLDIPLPEASLGGSLGIGELGHIVAAGDIPLEVQLGVQGSAGRRDGIAANLSFRYTFRFSEPLCPGPDRPGCRSEAPGEMFESPGSSASLRPVIPPPRIVEGEQAWEAFSSTEAPLPHASCSSRIDTPEAKFPAQV